ncbi:two-component system LytT family response regulator [Mucilaginibacter oryzae]|uniref:Two-component system LytT family response regulator n=1 Tax=Mucilaginibacter oryzae TaxID=468058 RepID=A0A316GS23_9SPHI|nr:LytTR family DNA-binding domain-containing protein [Mucilaginibacter oryzae]PWK64899.1 two-component system LytT family response regulator [Mucilaginibacter oryzae]
MSFEKIIISQQNRIHFIKPEEIVFCRSDNCYTNIHFLEGKQILTVKSLTKLHKELLSVDFLRVNQSFVINRRFIQSIDKKKRSIEMENGVLIPFTVSLKDLLLLIEKGTSLITSGFEDLMEV